VAHREFDSTDGARRETAAVRVGPEGASSVREQVAEEVPVALVYNGTPHVVVMATPMDLEDLALGFSLSEGIIENAAELAGIEVVPEELGYSAYLSIPKARVEAIESRRRNMAARTGCGLCGAETIAQAIRVLAHVPHHGRIRSESVVRAVAQLPKMQSLNAATGATHAAGWADLAGEVRRVREDVGRHNALDKLIGALVAAGMDTASGFAVITSRASYEMVQKAAAAGIGLVAAVSAPTGFAVRTALEANVTLVGFARDRSFVVYADAARRLTTDEEWKS
jgi:FdhD protein